MATPTASGKTLIYALACLQQLLADPVSKALFLFPIKALEQDQRKAMEEWAAVFLPISQGPFGHIRRGYPAQRRKKIRQEPPPILISNPDMLHLGLLPFHETMEGIF